MNTLEPDIVKNQNLKINSTGVFEGLREDVLQDLESRGLYMEYDQEIVTASGHEIGYFFYIVKGSFEVSKVERDSGKKITLATIGEGECFGEMSFFMGTPATANVIAVGKVACWAIPHDSLREFINQAPQGAQLAVNIGALMARRVQEGNTRLIGMSSTLSAYFGNVARQQQKGSMDSPQSGDPAEMEFPDEVFDVFVRETLELKPESTVTPEQRRAIRLKIEKNELDIVPWLEKGGGGRQLKMRLQIVDPHTPKTGASPVDRRHAAVVRIPQVRARISPPPPAKSLRSPLFTILNVSSYVLLPTLSALIILFLLPLEARQSLTLSPGFQSNSLARMAGRIILRTSVRSNPWTLSGKTSHQLQMHFPKKVLLNGDLKLSQSIPSSQKIHVIISNPNAMQVAPVDVIIELVPGTDSYSLFSKILPEGTYQLECHAPDWPAGLEIPVDLQLSTSS